ncbi:MAG TPA: argininosuccinate lyase [Candidatus Dormibacteraeota bacterium]|nr:argininosuccinate lyase [Candidatus Dormibacteraeota bacterium]
MTERGHDKLWGGRFDQAPDRTFYEFQRSFPFDRQLLPYELAVDRAWAAALVRPKILTEQEVTETLAGLDHIAQRAYEDSSWLDQSPAEDVHHFVEQALVEKIGPLGWKLHTGRSRNELIATDFRLFVKDSATGMRHAVIALIAALAAQAEQHLATPMPGMTHMQHAQPILLAHFLLAHAEAFTRDLTRLAAAAESADACPMGSGALAGCSFAIDREAIAQELGFSRITANSLDAVSDRDFALDYLFALAGMATHLSRLAEDFIIFASQEFAWVVLADEFSTGSSLMPQKKNPDVWELLRGKTGRITTALHTLLITLKGLPSSYQRDLQEDKEPLFAAHEQALTMLQVAAGAIRTTRFNSERLVAAVSDPALLATEVADYLVRRGIPFRKAHDIVGNILRHAEAHSVAWNQLPVAELKKFSTAFDSDFHQMLTLDAALGCKGVPGGTAPQAVREQLADLRKRLSQTGMAA